MQDKAPRIRNKLMIVKVAVVVPVYVEKPDLLNKVKETLLNAKFPVTGMCVEDFE